MKISFFDIDIPTDKIINYTIRKGRMKNSLEYNGYTILVYNNTILEYNIKDENMKYFIVCSSELWFNVKEHIWKIYPKIKKYD